MEAPLDESTSSTYNLPLWQTLVILIVCSLSLLGSTILIVSYALWPHLRTKSRLLLACLSVGDYLNALGMLVAAAAKPFPYKDATTNYYTNAACTTQAFITTAGSLASFFWTTSMAIYLYIAIVRSDSRLADRLVFVFHLVSWGVPLFLALLALEMNQLGYASTQDSAGWCWITDHGLSHRTEQLVWMTVTGKGWEVLSYVLVVCLYVAIKCHLQVKMGKDTVDIIVSMILDFAFTFSIISARTSLRKEAMRRLSRQIESSPSCLLYSFSFECGERFDSFLSSLTRQSCWRIPL